MGKRDKVPMQKKKKGLNYVDTPPSKGGSMTPYSLSMVGLNSSISALTGVAEWIGHCSANQKVASSTPSQGTCLGCRPGSQLGACKRQLINVFLAHKCFSASLFLPFPFL